MDIKIELGFAVREQVLGMFRIFFPDSGAEDAQAFADAVMRCGDVTPAWVQEICLRTLDTGMRELLQEVHKKLGDGVETPE